MDFVTPAEASKPRCKAMHAQLAAKQSAEARQEAIVEVVRWSKRQKERDRELNELSKHTTNKKDEISRLTNPRKFQPFRSALDMNDLQGLKGGVKSLFYPRKWHYLTDHSMTFLVACSFLRADTLLIIDGLYTRFRHRNMQKAGYRWRLGSAWSEWPETECLEGPPNRLSVLQPYLAASSLFIQHKSFKHSAQRYKRDERLSEEASGTSKICHLNTSRGKHLSS